MNTLRNLAMMILLRVGLGVMLLLALSGPAYPWDATDEQRWYDCSQRGFACESEQRRDWEREQRRQEQRRQDIYQDEIYGRGRQETRTCYTRRDTFGNLVTTCY